MYNKNFIFTASMLTSLMLSACTTTSVAHSLQKNKHDKIYIVQEGKQIAIPSYIDNDIPVVKIEKKPFAIRFSNKEYTNDKFYSYKIATVTDKSKFDLAKVGMDLGFSSNKLFSSGKALSQVPNEDCGTAYVRNWTYLYLHYDPESLQVKLLGRDGEYLKQEFKVCHLVAHGENLPVERSNVDELNIMAFNDKNLNDIIDNGELSKFIIRF